MDALQELGSFVACDEHVSMRLVGEILSILPPEQTNSLQAMIAALPGLPAVTLRSEIVGDRFGPIPFSPTVHIEPSGGVILETRISLLNTTMSVKVGNSGQFRPIVIYNPGIGELLVSRTGIDSSGLTTLENPYHVEGFVTPSPSPPPVPPNLASVTQSSNVYEVKGSKFLHNHAVHIRVANSRTLQDNTFQATAGVAGDLDAKITLPPLDAHTHLVFSANDERPNPDDPFTGTLWSNSIPLETA